MARVVMVGAGLVGLSTALLLHRDGHDVTVLERDLAPPPDPEQAWGSWQRRGVAQFRLPHLLLARFAATLRAELPDLTAALVDAGALRANLVALAPDFITGGVRPGDQRYEILTGRRPVVEAVVARAADLDGLDVRRGVGVAGVRSEVGRDGLPHVSGVVTEDGADLPADLVVDCGGRRSPMAGWLRAAGSAGPHESIEDCGFVYYAVHFRSADGSLPPMLGPALQPHGSITTLTLPADNGTWSVVVGGLGRDKALRRVRDRATWDALVRRLPTVAHWIDAEAITGVDVMAGLEDRHRSYVGGGVPVATGVVPLGDASTATNPSLGRGVSLGLLGGVVLRDALRRAEPAGRDFVLGWQALMDERVQPLLTDTLTFDRHRRAEMQAAIDGGRYETADPTWQLRHAIVAAATSDPELFRAALELNQALRPVSEVLADGDVLARLPAGPRSQGGPPTLSRNELLSTIGALPV